MSFDLEGFEGRELQAAGESHRATCEILRRRLNTDLLHDDVEVHFDIGGRKGPRCELWLTLRRGEAPVPDSMKGGAVLDAVRVASVKKDGEMVDVKTHFRFCDGEIYVVRESELVSFDVSRFEGTAEQDKFRQFFLSVLQRLGRMAPIFFRRPEQKDEKKKNGKPSKSG